MSNNGAKSIYAEALKREKAEAELPIKPTQNVTHPRDIALDKSRVPSTNQSRDELRKDSRNSLTRDEIQVFSFHLRDELKVKAKIQAEVPHTWQSELEEIAIRLNVKKLELYRYIIGMFLGKTVPQK